MSKLGGARAPNSRRSRQLTKLLRHDLHTAGIRYRSDGFTRVADVLTLQRFRDYTVSEIQRITADCNKQRFELRRIDGDLWVRATNGHTIPNLDDESMLQRVRDPGEIPVCVHGTNMQAWPNIKESGLCRMARHHVHLARGLPNDKGVISGMRNSSEVHIFVNPAKAMDAGCVFYMSPNGVILTPGIGPHGSIPTSCFDRVVSSRTGKTLMRAPETPAAPHRAAHGQASTEPRPLPLSSSHPGAHGARSLADDEHAAPSLGSPKRPRPSETKSKSSQLAAETQPQTQTQTQATTRHRTTTATQES